MFTMTWKRSNGYGTRYFLQLTFEFESNKLEGTITVNPSYNATFKFPSMGIASKKIKLATDEEMQAEAEKFLLNKIEKRLKELEQIKLLLNKRSS